MPRKGALSVASAVLAVVVLAAACVWATVNRAAGSSVDQRARVAQMDPAEKRDFQQAQKRFLALDAQQQDELRRLHEQIQQSPDRQQLYELMDRYYHWLETLSAYERLELRRMDPAERLARVKAIVERQRQMQVRLAEGRRRMRAEMAKRMLPKEFSSEDLDGVLKWMKRFAGQDTQSLLRYVPEDRRENMAKALDRTRNDLEARLHLLGWLWLRWQWDHPEEPLPLHGKDFDSLLESLSAPSRTRLAKLPAEQQKKVLARVIRFLVVSNFASRNWRQAPPLFDEREMVALLEERLTPERRDQLWRMSPEERQRRLWIEFLRSKMPELAPAHPGGPPFGIWPGSGRSRRMGGRRGAFRRPSPDDQPPPADGSGRPPFPPPGGPGRAKPPHQGPLGGPGSQIRLRGNPARYRPSPPEGKSPRPAGEKPVTDHSESAEQSG